jgi:nucleoid-associated protein EbfC
VFGNLFGDLEKKQNELKDQLKKIEIEGSSSDGLIKLKVNALREILNIEIHEDLLTQDSKEKLEDILLSTLNDVLEKAKISESEHSKKLVTDMLPPGFSHMAGMIR